jgi:hypothetical protein
VGVRIESGGGFEQITGLIGHVVDVEGEVEEKKVR